jgi:hypothetical protein
MLREIFESRRDKVAKGWRMLHSEKPIDFTLYQILLG